MTYHKEQQACKDNTYHSWTIPVGPVKQNISIDTVEDIPKQCLKTNRTQHNVFSQWIGKQTSNCEW